jgi:hypothetical protein
MKEERKSPAPSSRGKTQTAQGENQEPKPRLPHERDESADSQSADNPAARRMGELAHDDVQDGLQDTTKGRELDATYRKLRKEPGQK